MNQHRIIVHEKSVAHRLLVIIPEYDLLEERFRMCSWSCSKTDLCRVEVLQHFAPPAFVESRVASVALVRYDAVERMDRDVEFSCLGIFVDIFPKTSRSLRSAEQVDRHPLNRTDVNERTPRLRLGQVVFGKDFGIETKVLVKIFPVETVTVDFVDPIELQTGLGFEGSHLRGRLGGERASVHQKEDPT